MLEGERVERSSLVHARACGVALGELHAALREIDPGPAPSLARYGDLELIHPRVPDPWSLARDLPLDERSRERMSAILERLRGRIPHLYATLPQQLCHNDFSPGNLLMRGDAVGAVLDFEFVAPDLRALDVCTCWYWLALRGWNGGNGMDAQAVRALLDGYAASTDVPLTPDELHAMPDLALLRATVSIIHRAGRHRAGLDTEQSVLDRVDLLLGLDDWLASPEAPAWPTLER
jgi:Ser/Thr protein kinase RdoA (MazF antagonist)